MRHVDGYLFGIFAMQSVWEQSFSKSDLFETLYLHCQVRNTYELNFAKFSWIHSCIDSIKSLYSRCGPTHTRVDVGKIDRPEELKSEDWIVDDWFDWNSAIRVKVWKRWGNHLIVNYNEIGFQTPLTFSNRHGFTVT